MRRISLLLATLLVALSIDQASAVVTTEFVANGFAPGVHLTAPPEDHQRLFVVERNGLITIVDKDTNNVHATPFLDITGSVNTDGEGGLLSLAFHPDYASNRFFFVFYTADLSPGSQYGVRVSRFTVSANPDLANAASETVFYEIIKPSMNHNGGQLGFRPTDAGNYLYLSLGDGGLGCDPNRFSQDRDSQFGKILRIDVDRGPSGDVNHPYAPLSNPLVNAPGDDLVWALGFRNPFRFTFDRANGDLYVGDVGRDTREEVDFEPGSSAGNLNFGWTAREGSIDTPTCPDPDPVLPEMIDPIYDYDHNGGVACVIGGYVYRGTNYASLYGRYFFADFMSGQIWSFVRNGNGISDLQEHTTALNPSQYRVLSFGEDADGDVYFFDDQGSLYRIIDPDSPPLPVSWGSLPSAIGGTIAVATVLWYWNRKRRPASPRTTL